MERGTRHFASALAFELAPAAVFNFAVAFAVASLLEQAGLGELAAPASVAAGIAAFLTAWLAIRRFGSSDMRFALPRFDNQQLELEPDELLLTDVFHAPAAQQSAEDELLLDDVLASIDPDSRVVQLFDPKAMPTAGELQERIDRHLRGDPVQPIPDATRELHEALAALRQSLR